jgi:phosphoribosylglycinamide formyltransferase-1
VETLFLDPKAFTTKRSYEEAIVKELRARNVEFVVLAGFMRILTPYIVNMYRTRMINVHPALLPAFKGAHGIRDSYNAGVKVAGVTIHFVTPELDSGPIIMQKAFAVNRNETLASFERKIHKIEYEIYPQAIQLLVRNKLKIKRGRVIIA